MDKLNELQYPIFIGNDRESVLSAVDALNDADEK